MEEEGAAADLLPGVVVEVEVVEAEVAEAEVAEAAEVEAGGLLQPPALPRMAMEDQMGVSRAILPPSSMEIDPRASNS